MSKTANLRKVIKTSLDTISGATYYHQAPDNAAYPYKVFDLSSVSFEDAALDRYVLDVDVWDLCENGKTIEEIADNIEPLFNQVNSPQTNILPTFFRLKRLVITDEDKHLQRIQLQFEVQCYET